MAVRTIFELFDILVETADYKIQATDKEGETQTIIAKDVAYKYMLHKYGTRRYSVLRGTNAATTLDGVNDFLYDYRMWITNRQHNIDRMYQALFDYNYSPIENVDRYENETIDATDATTYGHKNTQGGTDSVTYGKKNTQGGTDSITYGKKNTEGGTDSLAHGLVETLSGTDSNRKNETDTLTKSGSESHEIEKAGFNSPNAYTNDTKDTLSFNNREDETTIIGADSTTYGKKTTNSGTDTTTYGKTDTLSGSDSTTYGKTDTLSGSDSTTYGKTDTESGTDSTDRDSERELHVHGNIGVTTNTALINEELELRIKSLAEMLIDNFINDYTFYS